MKPTKHVQQAAPAPAARPQIKLTRFAAPEDMPDSFGVVTAVEDHIQGFVPTPHVRELLDAFGLQDRTSVVFPFQHIKKANGEIWRMRIEPATSVLVDGEALQAHPWVYMRDYPEMVGGQQ